MTQIPQEDFIGVFDNVLNKKECQEIINHFEETKRLNLTYDRQKFGDTEKHDKDDETCFVISPNMLPMAVSNPIISTFLNRFWECYNQYAKTFSVLLESEIHGIISMRLQKTLPGQGYHHWHYESSTSETARRVCAWSVYLNDIDEGGETEFLYMRKRVKPEAGTVLIWPAGFTHTHRGNPPLSNEKYLLTGWVEFMGNPRQAYQ
mgnify:CR=1 FL=1